MNIKEQQNLIEEIAPLKSNRQGYRPIRHLFFNKIKTELQAYLLGLHAADGTVEESRAKFKITLNEQDLNTVNLFRDSISPAARTYFNSERLMHNTRNNKDYIIHPNYTLEICSRQLVTDLINFGFGQGKTYKDLHLPKLNDNLLKAFILGYFDGDGCITGWYQKDGNRERFRMSFDICSKTKSLLLEIQEFFKKYNIKVNINYITRDDMYRLKTSSIKEVKKLYNLLYLDSNFFMQRKYLKFNHYVNTEVSQLIAEHRNAQEVNVNESNNPPKSAEQDNDWLENNYFDYIKS